MPTKGLLSRFRGIHHSGKDLKMKWPSGGVLARSLSLLAWCRYFDTESK
jgi:hypothetical protein